MEFNYQMNAQMDAQKKYEMMKQNPMMQNPMIQNPMMQNPMMQNPMMPNSMMPNPMINMNEQNNFFNHDLTNKMDNLFIENQGYNNNGYMAMKQNQIEKKTILMLFSEIMICMKKYSH